VEVGPLREGRDPVSQVLYILLAVVLVRAISLLLGNAVLRAINASLHRGEAKFLAFVLGSSLLTPIIRAMSMLGAARRGAFLAVCAVLLAIGIWRRAFRFPRTAAPQAPLRWRVAFWAIYLTFATTYFVTALAPP
jgi:hypothetical protein